MRCAGALRLPAVDIAAGAARTQAWIGDRAFETFEDSPAGQIARRATLLAPVRPGLVVSDDAIADCSVRVSEAEWARFVDVCNALRTVHARAS